MTTKMKSDLLKSAIHGAETLVVGAVALTIVYMFKDDADVQAAVRDALLNVIPVAGAAFLAKFNRSTDVTPGSDYVNQIK